MASSAAAIASRAPSTASSSSRRSASVVAAHRAMASARCIRFARRKGVLRASGRVLEPGAGRGARVVDQHVTEAQVEGLCDGNGRRAVDQQAQGARWEREPDDLECDTWERYPHGELGQPDLVRAAAEGNEVTAQREDHAGVRFKVMRRFTNRQRVG